MPRSGVTMTLDRLGIIAANIRSLGERQVLVGIPEEKTDRPDDAGITNAAIGFIQEHGAPEANIPARPFLVPGVRDARGEVGDRLKATANGALDGNTGIVERGLAGAGQIAATAVQRRIRAGIPPPLAPSTIAARRRRSAGSSYRRKAVSASDTTPLIDTGQLVKAVTFVIRKK